MGAEEVEPYVLHRMSLVGWNGRPKFTPDAFAALYRGSDGVPRRLNQLAGRVLLFGAIEQADVIDAKVVDAVIADITGDMPAPSAPAPRPVVAAPEPKPEPEIVAVPEPIKAREPVATREPLAAVEPAAPANDPRPAPIEIAHDRFAAIEARLEEQDAALRRVLALLVDWVEGNEAAAARGGRAA
jgi:hypothetical protein